MSRSNGAGTTGTIPSFPIPVGKSPLDGFAVCGTEPGLCRVVSRPQRVPLVRRGDALLRTEPAGCAGVPFWTETGGADGCKGLHARFRSGDPATLVFVIPPCFPAPARPARVAVPSPCRYWLLASPNRSPVAAGREAVLRVSTRLPFWRHNLHQVS